MDTRVEIRPGRFMNVTIYKNHSSHHTIFLIHGLGGRADQWREQIPLLKEKYSIVIPHLLGHGKSDMPKPRWNKNPYNFSEFAADIKNVFNRFQDEKNSVIGHSYGGALATSLAFTHQKKIDKLILIDPVPCMPSKVVPLIYKYPVFILEWIRPTLEKQFEKLAFAPQADPALVSFETQASKINKMYVIKAMVKSFNSIPKLDMSQLKVPTLIIIGEDDKVILPVMMQEFYQAIPHYKFIFIKNAGHMPMLEKSNEVNNAILGFL